MYWETCHGNCTKRAFSFRTGAIHVRPFSHQLPGHDLWLARMRLAQYMNRMIALPDRVWLIGWCHCQEQFPHFEPIKRDQVRRALNVVVDLLIGITDEIKIASHRYRRSVIEQGHESFAEGIELRGGRAALIFHLHQPDSAHAICTERARPQSIRYGLHQRDRAGIAQDRHGCGALHHGNLTAHFGSEFFHLRVSHMLIVSWDHSRRVPD